MVCISTYGDGIYNKLILYDEIDENNKIYYAVYENPYLRDYYKYANIKEGRKVYKHKLTKEMADEFPVPLPTEAKTNPQQKRFQNKIKPEDLIKEQNALADEMKPRMREIHNERFEKLKKDSGMTLQGHFHIYASTGYVSESVCFNIK